jgi:RNA polymerase sigma-70 factor (ECF subfamily)
MAIQQTLIEKASQGDRLAQYHLYQSCYPILLVVCRRYRKNEQDAHAVLNQGFLKIIVNLSRYRFEEVPFEVWIRRVMINVAIDVFRTERKWRESVDLKPTAADLPMVAVNWNDADHLFNMDTLESMIQRLNPISQQVFNLYAIDGYSHREIAELLGFEEGTSKWYLSKARAQLQEWIALEMKEKSTKVSVL